MAIEKNRYIGTQVLEDTNRYIDMQAHEDREPVPTVSFTPGLAASSAEDKAREYNTLLSQGFTDAQIKAAADAAFGSQSAQDWSYLTGLASSLAPKNNTQTISAAPTFGALSQAVLSTDSNALYSGDPYTGMASDWSALKSDVTPALTQAPSPAPLSAVGAASQQPSLHEILYTPGGINATAPPIEQTWDGAYSQYRGALRADAATPELITSLYGSLSPDFANNINNIYGQILRQQQAGTDKYFYEGNLGSKQAAAMDMAFRLAEAGITSLADLGQRSFVTEQTDGEGGTQILNEQELFNKKTGESIQPKWNRLRKDSGTDLIYDFYFTPEGGVVPYTTNKPSRWVSAREGIIKPALSIASLAFPAIAPYVAAGNAINAAQKGDWGSAIVSGLTAMGGISGLPTEVAEGLNNAKTAASVLNAIEKGNPLAIANALSQTDVGKQLINTEIGSGVTIGNVLDTAKIAAAVDKGQYAEALNYAGSLTNNPNLMVAGSAVNVVKSIESGNPFNIINAIGQLQGAVAKASPPEGGITNRVYDDAMVQSGADAFLRAKEAGASDDDAMAAANAVSTPVADLPPSTATITTPKDLGEFAGLDQAIATQKAASTVNIGNAEADTPEEAAALARTRNPDARSFTFGGREYTFGASSADIDRVTREAKLSEIRDASSFNEAYRQARDLLGPNQTFEWQGKQYSTATAQERPDLSGSPAGVQQDQSDAETVRLIRQNNELVSGNAPDQSAAETARLTSKNTQLEDAKIRQNVDAAKAAINSVLGEGTASNIVMQGLSNLHQAVGQTFDFFGGTGAALGLAGADNVMTRVGQNISKTGEALQLESVNEANSNVIKAVQKADGLGAKIWEGAKAIIENPLSANMAAVELIQEALPIGVAAKVWGLAGKFAAIGADVGLNAIESGGAAYNEKYQQAIKEGKSQEEADKEGTKAFYIASAVTAVTGGIMDTALVNKVTKAFDDAASAAATKTVGKGAVSAAKEAPTEAAEVFATGVITDLALGRVPDIDKILTQSVVEGFVGGKTAGAVDASSAVDQTVADIAGPAATPSTVAPDVDVALDVAPKVTPSAAPVLEASPESLAENVSAAVDSGLDPATVINDYVNEVLRGGGDAQVVVSDSVASSIASGASSDVVINSAVSSAINAGSSPSIVIDSAVVAAINAGSNPSTAVESAVGSAVNSGVAVESAVSSAVAAAVNSGANVNTVVDAATNVATNTGATVTADTNVVTTTNLTTNTQSSVDVNTGVTTTVDSNNNVTTTVDPNTNTTTAVDTNNNVTSQTTVNPETNTQTTVTVDTNTKTQTVVDSNTNTVTSTTVDTNSNVTTQTTINTNTNTQTTVVTDPNTNTQTTIKVNIDTGEITDEVETAIPSGWTPPVINDPVVPNPVAPAKTTAAPKAAAPKTVGSAGLAGGMGAMLPASFEMDETLLPSRVTQRAIDPLARVMEAQAELEKTTMMNQIDPRLLSVLQQRIAPEQQQAQQQQFDKDIGALSRLLSGQPANTSDYYSYGIEDSIDSILGGRAVGFKEGGYVEPLKAAEGGMALPLLAKSGGALSHYGGREDYKDGKHVAGEGDGQSDDIPAWLADGEYVLDAELVSALGNGSTKAGVELLDEFRRQIRAHKRGGSLNTIPPKSKSPLSYLRSAEKSLKKK